MFDSSSKTDSKQGIFYGWYLVAISWGMTFLLGATSVGIFFKPMLDEFGWTRATLSMVSSIAMLVFAVAYPFLGRLIDRFGPRKILFACIGSQALSYVINGLAANIWHVYVGRFFLEIKPTHGTQVLINRWFERKRGQALGILSTGTPLGTLILTPLSQYLITLWGWRPTLLFWAGVTVLVLLPLTLLIRNKPEDKGLRPDGAITVRQPLSSELIQPRSNKSAFTVQKETGNSLTEAVKTRGFWMLASTQLFCGISCGLLMTHTIIFATDLGYSPLIGASFMSIQGGVSLVGVLVTGQLSDRFARNKVLSFTHLIRCTSFIALIAVFFMGSGNIWLLYLAMALFGFGWFTTAPLSAGLAADLFGYLRMGTILGIILASHTIGSALGTYAGGITFQLTGSYLYIFILTGALEFLAACFALIIKKT